MSRNFTSGADHMDSASPAYTAPTFAMGLWVNTTAAQSRRFMAVAVDSTNSFEVGLNIASTNGQGAVRVWHGGTDSQVLGSNTISTSTWQCVVAAFATGITETIWAFGSKNSSGGLGSPGAGTYKFTLSGRPFDNTSGIGGGGAHAFFLSQVPTDIEVAFLQAGGNYRLLKNCTNAWRVDQSSGTEPDLVGSMNLTVNGTSAFGSDPNIGTFWTAAALGAQSWTQGSAITSIDFTTKVGNDHAPYTVTVKTLGAGSNVTTTNGATGSNPRVLNLTSAASFSAGDYLGVTAGGTPTCVLQVSSNTVLVQNDQSYVNAAAVYRYAASTKTFTGPSITANVLSGTPAAGDVGSYTLIPRYTNNANSAIFTDGPSFAVTVASSSAAASFSAGPTLTSTNTDGYSFAVTSNQTATCWLGVYVKGSATPTAANVIAGTGTGFVSHFSQALTLNIAGSISATGLTNPIYDLYLCLTNGNGNSANSVFTALLKAPPAGKQYTSYVIPTISAITKANPAAITATAHGRSSGDWVEIGGVAGMTQINGAFSTCTVIDANTFTLDTVDSSAYSTYTSGGYLTWGQSSVNGASTTAVTGDVGVCDITDPQGAPVTLRPDGVTVYSTPSSLRQSVTVDFYSVSGGALVGTNTDYMNDQAPLGPSGPALAALAVATGQAVNISLVTALGVTDPQVDTLTATATTALPTGLSVSASNLTGTATVAGTTQVTFRFTNLSGEFTDVPTNVTVGGLVAPNLVGLLYSDAQAVVLGFAILSSPPAVQNSSQPANTVIAQLPLAGAPLSLGQTIAVTVSNGISTPVVSPTLVTGKSTFLVNQEFSGAYVLTTTPVVEEVATVSSLATDLGGFAYRFMHLPSSAIILDLLLQNDPNGTGSLYKIGLFNAYNGAVVLPGADAVLASGLSMDSGRFTWTPIYSPSVVGNAVTITNQGLALWQLLGLASDPSTQTSTVLYDLVVSAITPGTGGGNMALRVRFVMPSNIGNYP